MKDVVTESERLCLAYPEAGARVRGKERDVVQAWKTLLARSQARQDKLMEAEQLHIFLNTFRSLRLERH